MRDFIGNKKTIYKTFLCLCVVYYYYYLAEKKSSWRGITVQMKSGFPPRVPSSPSPGGGVPPRK